MHRAKYQTHSLANIHEEPFLIWSPLITQSLLPDGSHWRISNYGNSGIYFLHNSSLLWTLTRIFVSIMSTFTAEAHVSTFVRVCVRACVLCEGDFGKFLMIDSPQNSVPKEYSYLEELTNLSIILNLCTCVCTIIQTSHATQTRKIVAPGSATEQTHNLSQIICYPISQIP
jgi:hypothetical protein